MELLRCQSLPELVLVDGDFWLSVGHDGSDGLALDQYEWHLPVDEAIGKEPTPG